MVSYGSLDLTASVHEHLYKSNLLSLWKSQFIFSSRKMLLWRTVEPNAHIFALHVPLVPSSLLLCSATWKRFLVHFLPKMIIFKVETETFKALRKSKFALIFIREKTKKVVVWQPCLTDLLLASSVLHMQFTRDQFNVGVNARARADAFLNELLRLPVQSWLKHQSISRVQCALEVLTCGPWVKCHRLEETAILHCLTSSAPIRV